MNFEAVKRQIQNNYDFDYGKAAESYKRLKIQLQKQYQEAIMTQYQQKISTIEAQQFSEIFLDNIIGSPINSAQQRETAEKVIKQVEEIVFELFQPDATGRRAIGEKKQKLIRKAAQQASAGIDTAKAAGAKYKGGTSKALISRFETVIKKEQSDVLDIVNTALVRGGILKNAQDSDEVANLIKGYATRVLLQKTTNRPKSKNPLFSIIKQEPFIEGLKGYYYEKANEEAINNLIDTIQREFSKASNVEPKKIVINVGGKANIAGQQTEIDLLFNSILNESQILNIFNKDYLGMTEIEEDELSLNSLKNRAKNVFGAQVKSFDLQAPKSNFYKIGGRQKLLEKLEADGRYGAGFSQVGAIAFLGQRQNIMDALGKRNVLFIDGQQRYWMYDFIKTFRAKNLYLTFEVVRYSRSSKNNKNIDLNYKNIYKASSQVALYNYASATYHRGQDYMI